MKKYCWLDGTGHKLLDDGHWIVVSHENLAEVHSRIEVCLRLHTSQNVYNLLETQSKEARNKVNPHASSLSKTSLAGTKMCQLICFAPYMNQIKTLTTTRDSFNFHQDGDNFRSSFTPVFLLRNAMHTWKALEIWRTLQEASRILWSISWERRNILKKVLEATWVTMVGIFRENSRIMESSRVRYFGVVWNI